MEGLADHGMMKVATDPDDYWTLSSKRKHPDKDEKVEVNSPYYINMTGFGFHEDVKEPMMVWLEEDLESDIVAGLNTGGNTMASSLGGYSINTDDSISVIPVRKAGGDEKYTGARRLGLPDDIDIKDKEIDLVDDVGTTGGSLAGLHELLGEADAKVDYWNIAANRMEGVKETAESYGAEVNALVDAREALDILYELGEIDGREHEVAVNYTEDPMEWNIDKGFV